MNNLFFFDRDGIVNRKPVDDYVKSITEFIFNPDFFEVFKSISQSGYKTILITNQQGIGKGLMQETDLIQIHNYMQSVLLENTDRRFDDIFYCTSLASENDPRRKPNTGMIEEALGKHNAKANNSFIIGDSHTDVQAGQKAGLKTILINSEKIAEPDYYYKTLNEFLRIFF